MAEYNLPQSLLNIKTTDYMSHSAMMPDNTWIFGNLFAHSLGTSAGKIISIYDAMFSQIYDNHPVEEIQTSVGRDISKKSKVRLKFPFMKPKQVRICGFEAMNHSKFFDIEVELYYSLMSDLGTTPVEYITEKCRGLGKENPQKYGTLLQKKQQSIYDYNVLMGLVDDDLRFEELKANMHDDVAKYFEMVTSMHKGKFGITWPLSLRKFSTPIRDELYNDTISYEIQEGVGNNYNFALPEKNCYSQIIDQVKETLKVISSTRSPLKQKLEAAMYLPATVFFLSGINDYAYTPEYAVKDTVKNSLIEAKFVNDNDVLAAPATTTSSIACGKQDVFVGTVGFSTTYSILVQINNTC
jgi:hypothetical protein